MPEGQIVLVDVDASRREQIREMIEASGIAVAAYGSASNFDARPAKGTVFLVADEKRLLQSMTVFLSHYGSHSLIIAYRPDPAVHDVVEAMKLGATDYLAWPFGPAAVLQRLTALSRRGESAARPIPAPPAGDVSAKPGKRRASFLKTAAQRFAGCRNATALRIRAAFWAARPSLIPS